MLNIGKMAPGSERYYTEKVAEGPEDYYTHSGEAPGYWLANGSRELQLEGQVDAEDLSKVLQGLDPATGEHLGRPHKGQRIPGFDLTFRAPKSISLLFALGRADVSRQVQEAHDAAVKEAFSYLERYASSGRRGKGGCERIATSGFVAAAFRHRTSRAGDPLLHTHTLATNLVKGADGRWSALDAKRTYNHSLTAGYLYQAQLRRELTARLGVAWTEVQNGHAEIEGVPQDVIRAFSRRREEIEEQLAIRREDSAKAAQAATLDTRRAKDYSVSPEGLLAEWTERAARLGFGEQELEATLGKAIAKERSGENLVWTAQRIAKEITEERSSFNRQDVIRAWCNQLPEGVSVAQAEALADQFLSSELVVPILSVDATLIQSGVIRRSDGRVVVADKSELRYSTPEMLAIERQVIEGALARQNEGAGLATPEALATVLAKEFELSEEQKEMLARLATSGHGVEVIAAPAGTGKTTAFAAAREIWERSGRNVFGCALSARAAQELQAKSGIESYTINSLLIDLQHPRYGGLLRGSVLVVDEAGMVDTRKLEPLLWIAEQAGAKVVLAGDDRQLPEIDAGGAFRGIKNRTQSIELTENRRQEDPWERGTLRELRDGDPTKAMAAYIEHGAVVAGSDPELVRQRGVEDWWAHLQAGGDGLMLTRSRAEAQELNHRARLLMAEAGKLGEEIEVGERRFAVGDRVMTTRNIRRLGVLNGTRGFVETVDPEHEEITIRTDDRRSIALPQSFLEAGRLTHAYAFTGHKSQGATADRVFVFFDKNAFREWSYSTLSRGKKDNRLYVVTSETAFRKEVGGATEELRDPISQLLWCLNRSCAKELALDRLPLSELSEQLLEAEQHRIQEVLRRSPDCPAASLQSIEDRLEKTTRGLNQVSAELAERPTDPDLADREAYLRASMEYLAAEREKLHRQVQDHQRWVDEHTEELLRYEAIRKELFKRERGRALAVEAQRPPYLAKAVGEVPERPSVREIWRKAAGKIESYRARWEIVDPQRALGLEPGRDELEVTGQELGSAVRKQSSQGRELPLERAGASAFSETKREAEAGERERETMAALQAGERESRRLALQQEERAQLERELDQGRTAIEFGQVLERDSFGHERTLERRLNPAREKPDDGFSPR